VGVEESDEKRFRDAVIVKRVLTYLSEKSYASMPITLCAALTDETNLLF